MQDSGMYQTGGDLPDDIQQQVRSLVQEFLDSVRRLIDKSGIRPAAVRSLFGGSYTAVLTESSLFFAVQKHFGTPSRIFLDHRNKHLTAEQALDAARWDLGYDDPFLIAFPATVLSSDDLSRRGVVDATAVAHVQSEYQRMKQMMNLVQINPLFGPASYSVDHRLAFVLMPYEDRLTEIYSTIVKPTVEQEWTGLVSRRADDYKTNRAIIQDIWKGICEARIVIADLTGLNANVMYELGIAHTVGKETILIHQRSPDGSLRFPFDVTHIRRIEYSDSAIGGQQLRSELDGTLRTILSPQALS